MREKRRLDALARLVIRPDAIAKRLDDVIGRDPDVSRSLLDHLQQGLQDADHGSERPVLAFVEATQAVEMPEQLVGAVYEVDDHASLCRGPDPRAFPKSVRGLRFPRGRSLGFSVHFGTVHVGFMT